MTTLPRPVSGEKQPYSGNLEILEGIGRLGMFSGEYNIALGQCMKKRGTEQNLYFDH